MGFVHSFVHLSVCSSVCPDIFLELYHCFFSKFWHGARNPYEVVCGRARFSGNVFSPNVGKRGQKQSFLNLLENLIINFYRICSIMKIWLICWVLAQIPRLENRLSIGVIHLWRSQKVTNFRGLLKFQNFIICYFKYRQKSKRYDK